MPDFDPAIYASLERSFDRVVDCGGTPAGRRDGKGGTQPTALKEDVASAVTQRVDAAMPGGGYAGKIAVPRRISIKCSEFVATPGLDAAAYFDHGQQGRMPLPEYLTVEFAWDSVHRPRYDEASIASDDAVWRDYADAAACDEYGRPLTPNGQRFERTRGAGLLVAQQPGGSCTFVGGAVVRHPYASDGVHDLYAELATKQVYAGLGTTPLVLYGQHWTDRDLRSSSITHHGYIHPGDAEWRIAELYRESGINAALVTSDALVTGGWKELDGLATALSLEDDLPEQRQEITAWWHDGRAPGDGVMLKVGLGPTSTVFATTVPTERLSDLFPLIQAHLRYDSRRALTQRALDDFVAGAALKSSVSRRVPLGLRVEIDLMARHWHDD